MEEFDHVVGAPQCDAFVETNFHVDGVSYPMPTTETDPFGEEFVQHWPVTPYSLNVGNLSSSLARFQIWIDGEVARRVSTGHTH